MVNIKRYYTVPYEKALKSVKMVKSSEYNSLEEGCKMKKIYEIFFALHGKMDIFLTRFLMDHNAKNSGLSDKVIKFKLEDYGHGNPHLSEVYCFTKLVMDNTSEISVKVKNCFLMGAILHDESLSRGGLKKYHHSDSAEFVTHEFVKKMGENLLYPMNEEFNDIDLKLIRGLVLTHRIAPFKTRERLREDFPDIPINLLATVSVADKIGMMNPLNTRINTATADYYPSVHLEKFRKRFINDKSRPVFKYVVSLMLGKNDAAFLYHFFDKALKEGTEERKAMIAHDMFIITENCDR